jgi:hypothetical protein
MLHTTIVRRGFTLILSLSIILSIVPISIGHASDIPSRTTGDQIASTLATVGPQQDADTLVPQSSASDLPIEHTVLPDTVTAGTFAVTTIITGGQAAPNAVTSQWPITRTEDTSPTIVYSGTWTLVANALSIRASHGDYTWADANGETATFAFTGPWINLGFVTASNTGQADILIDGVNVGMVDTYSRDNEVGSFIFDNLGAGAHTLTIHVRGAHHPNSSGNTVSLDYIDVWDGTDMPTSRVEQNDPHVWRSASWNDVVDAAASGGSYMSDNNTTDATAWLAFTGDSISYVGYADGGAHRLGISIDGEWRASPGHLNRRRVARQL